MTFMLFLKPCVFALVALLVTAGCVRDAYYISAKDRRYNVVPAFTPAKITEDSWVDPADHSSALYTSSTVTAKARYHDTLLGKLHLRSGDDPEDESLVLHIRKEHRAYMAETPLSPPIRVGKRAITPHFAIGRHKDHKEMAGLVFRMPF